MSKFPFADQHVSCDRLFRHLLTYSQQEFGGSLAFGNASLPLWTLHFTCGRLAWATGGRHPRRRWRRQVYLVTGKKPDLSSIPAIDREGWDYSELSRLSGQELAPDAVRAIIYGTLAEILFDLVQACTQPANGASRPNTLTVEARHSQLPQAGSLFPPTWLPSILTLQEHVQQDWKRWVESGLTKSSQLLEASSERTMTELSLDSAPIVCSREKLRAIAPPKLYDNLIALLNGKRTLRDLALKVKRRKDPIEVARTLAPYVENNLIAWSPVSDLGVDRQDYITRTLELPQRPTAICVDPDPETSRILEALAEEAGYAFEWYASGLEALYKLSIRSESTPSSLWLADRLPPISGFEACSILRRLPVWQSVPIAVYSPEEQSSDRWEQAHLAGATEYICGKAFNSSQLLALLRQYEIPEVSPVASGDLEADTATPLLAAGNLEFA